MTKILAKDKPVSAKELEKVIAIESQMLVNLYSTQLDLNEENTSFRDSFSQKSHWKEIEDVFLNVVSHAPEGSYGEDAQEFFQMASLAVADKRTYKEARRSYL